MASKYLARLLLQAKCLLMRLLRERDELCQTGVNIWLWSRNANEHHPPSNVDPWLLLSELRGDRNCHFSFSTYHKTYPSTCTASFLLGTCKTACRICESCVHRFVAKLAAISPADTPQSFFRTFFTMTLEYLKVCCAIDTLSKFWSQLGERRVDRETQRKREGKSYLRPGVEREVTTLWGTPSNVWCWIKTDDWARLKLNRDHNVRFRHYFIELKNPFSHIWQKWYSALQIQFSYLIIYLSLLPPAVRRAKKENSKYNWQKTLPQMHLQPKNVLSYGLFSVYTLTHPCVVFLFSNKCKSRSQLQ